MLLNMEWTWSNTLNTEDIADELKAAGVDPEDYCAVSDWVASNTEWVDIIAPGASLVDWGTSG